MNMPFMKQFPWGEPTYFVEQLWNMLQQYGLVDIEESDLWFGDNSELNKYYDRSIKPNLVKLHTIRPHSDRIKEGMKIYPYIWAGRPYHSKTFVFMPAIEIISKQRFDIVKFKSILWPHIDGNFLTDEETLILAKNDGFKSIDQFFRYFNKPVENYEIKHFTNLKY